MGKQYDFFLKNVLIGDPGVGKTAIMNRVMHNEYKEDYMASISVDFKSKIVQQGGYNIKYDLWDTAGQEKFRSISSIHYKGADVLLCIFDINDERSFDNLINDWLEEIQIYCNHNSTLLLILGNKSDQKDDQMIGEQIKDLLKNNQKCLVSNLEEGDVEEDHFGYIYANVSARTGKGINEAISKILDFKIEMRKKRKIKANKEQDFGQTQLIIGEKNLDNQIPKKKCQNESELFSNFTLNEEKQEKVNKPSLEISKIIQNKQSLNFGEENLDVDDLIFQLQEGEIKNINNNFQKFFLLMKEDQEICQYFGSKLMQITDKIMKRYGKKKEIKQLKQFIEAMFYEQKIRMKEKMICFQNLKSNLDMKANQSKISDKLLNRLHQEVKLFKQLNELKKKRHAGTLIKKKSKQNISNTSDKLTDVYDWIVDIDLITKINDTGWRISFSKEFFENSSQLTKKNVIGEENFKKFVFKENVPENLIKDEQIKWEGAIVAVVGLYDKGKTFVLNNLSSSNLPSGKKVNTKGLSFKYVDIESGTKLILLDTAGSYSPVKVVNNFSIIEKEATEMFILDLVFDISDYFIFVVNDFTSLDQRYLDKLTRSLHNSPNKSFREVIVIHNFKEVESEEILNHIWENQVQDIYEKGSIKKTVVAAVNPITLKLEEKPVLWFKSKYTRHVCLVNQDSMLGLDINPWTFSLLKYWLKAVFIPINRQFSVVDSVINSATHKLSSYFKANINIVIQDTDEELTKIIKNKSGLESQFNLPQIAIDSSGFVMTRPDSFLPQVDIIKGDKYTIVLDLPGIPMEEIIVSRQNVYTIIKGCRKKQKSESHQNQGDYEKNERKFGEFNMRFKIPEEYERKWSDMKINLGVLVLEYDKDIDDFDEERVANINQFRFKEFIYLNYYFLF